MKENRGVLGGVRERGRSQLEKTLNIKLRLLTILVYLFWDLTSQWRTWASLHLFKVPKWIWKQHMGSIGNEQMLGNYIRQLLWFVHQFLNSGPIFFKMFSLDSLQGVIWGASWKYKFVSLVNRSFSQMTRWFDIWATVGESLI